MVFKGKGLRRWVLAVGSALVLAACGGGDTVVQFAPTRMIAFGDELSFLESDGRKYTVNGFNAATPPVLDCHVFPIWIQIVAGNFGMAFPQCPNSAAPHPALMRASVGQTVAQFTAAVDTFMANDAPKDQDLVTVMVGMHDVLALYNETPRRPEAQMIAELDARGALLAAQLNRIATAGPAVIVSTIPDLGKAPFARAAGGDPALLTRMVDAFNGAMRINMIQDGRLIGLVFGDAEIYNAVRFPGSFGYVNVTDAACTAPMPDCTTSTAIPTGATSATWLWGDATRPGPTFHNRLGNLALQRAVNNPF